MKAMVIDDSRAMRSLLKGILHGNGIDVVAEAGNGREALEVLQQEEGLGLALVDWNMPEMNGYEFVQAVRADTRWNELLILMVTTETEMERMASALEAGANEYIMKPFTKEGIRDKLELLGVLG